MAQPSERSRVADVHVTGDTRQQLLGDRPVEILIVATKTPDPGPFLGPPVDLAAVVG